MPLHAVIFDLDGTLIDSEVLWTKTFEEMLHEFGKKYDPAFQKNIMGTPGPKAMVKFKAEYQLDAPVEDIDKMREEYYARISKEHRPSAKPGADALLRSLHAAGIPLALATSSGHETVDEVFSRLGWKELFREVVVGTDVQNGKPAPDIYVEAARRMKCETNTCVAFEDSPNGVRSASGAGLVVVGVKDERYVKELPGASVTVTSLTEMDPEKVRALVS